MPANGALSLTPEQAAERLAVSPKTLSNWRSLNKGPNFFKVGATVRYLEADLLAFIDENRVITAGGAR